MHLDGVRVAVVAHSWPTLTSELRKLGAKGGSFVLDADIRDYFGSISHGLIERTVAHHTGLAWVRLYVGRWLCAPIQREDDTLERPTRGTPQGGVASPLLANLFMHYAFDAWMQRTFPKAPSERFADDAVVHCRSKRQAESVLVAIRDRLRTRLVVMCRTRKDCEQAEARIMGILKRLRLELHPHKTRRLDLFFGQEGFDFLGCHLRKRLSGRLWEQKRKRLYFLQRCPSGRSMRRVRQRAKELTLRSRCHANIRLVIGEVNPMLRGWDQYFRTGNAARQFCSMDSDVVRRLCRLRVKRNGRYLQPGEAMSWTREYVERLGLYRLRGTIKYPGEPPGRRARNAVH